MDQMIRVLSFSDSISAEPYHIVMYHDMYYLIGNRPGMENLSHYRIDLMSDLKVLTDDVGNPVRRTPAAKLAGAKETVREWDPMKYMSEHLNMGYDEPRRIKIKIPKDQRRDRQVKRKIWGVADRNRKIKHVKDENFHNISVNKNCTDIMEDFLWKKTVR